MRETAAITAARLVASLCRLTRLGGGTTLPGRVAAMLWPGLIPGLSARLAGGVVLISGTNGKTTTARSLAGILDAAGISVVHNRAGANLLSGIATALAAHASRRGQTRADVGLFEVDEATLPAAVEATRPRVVVLLNLFRDQLDRYGEIDLVAERWRHALAALPPESALAYNADDPMVADLCRAREGRVLAFGLEDVPRSDTRTLEHAADARYCYRCGRPYEYSLITLGHMGHYRCPGCGAARTAPQVRAREVRLHGADGGAAAIVHDGAQIPVATVLPGLYNIYDVTAAAAAGLALGIAPEAVARGIAATAPAFGRGERVGLEGRDALMLLAKNPAGFNEVLRTVLLAEAAPVVLIAINDLIADGRDISWLWDVDFEMLAERARAVVTTGLRAEDMALRLKYAGLETGRMSVERDGERALAAARQLLREGERLYILPTYTAMLHLREILARRGAVRGFWKD